MIDDIPIGRCIAVHPVNYGQFGLGKTSFLVVKKETHKQVRAEEMDGIKYIRTVHKRDIIGVIKNGGIISKQIEARDLHKEYTTKQRELFDEYHAKMIAIGEE